MIIESTLFGFIDFISSFIATGNSIMDHSLWLG